MPYKVMCYYQGYRARSHGVDGNMEKHAYGALVACWDSA